MKLFLILLLAIIGLPSDANAYDPSSILNKTRNTVDKLEMRDQQQCKKEADVFLQTSGMHREICEEDDKIEPTLLKIIEGNCLECSKNYEDFIKGQKEQFKKNIEKRTI